MWACLLCLISLPTASALCPDCPAPCSDCPWLWLLAWLIVIVLGLGPYVIICAFGMAWLGCKGALMKWLHAKVYIE